MGHASNSRIIKAFKLLTGMGDFNAEYKPAEVYSNSEQFDSDNEATEERPEPLRASTSHAINNDFDSLCAPCLASKQTRVVNRSKPMTEVKEMLEEVHVDLWGPHNPPSLSGKTYAAILLNAKTRKTWVHYLRSKDEFVDVFQIWLPKVEKENKLLMRSLCTNGGGKFISAKLKEFCEGRGITIKYAAPYMYKENGLAI